MEEKGEGGDSKQLSSSLKYTCAFTPTRTLSLHPPQTVTRTSGGVRRGAGRQRFVRIYTRIYKRSRTGPFLFDYMCIGKIICCGQIEGLMIPP